MGRIVHNFSLQLTTLPFCQNLINEGHQILHISSHGPGEFGKDIITIDSEGDVCIYQLNTGKITKSIWLNKLHNEIIELTKLPPKHPAIPENGKIHKAYLVTNGEIAREVKDFIDQMNRRNRKRKTEIAFLNIIDINLLLSKFIEAQGEFLPKQLNEFYTFLSFYLDDGRGFISKEKFFNFLKNTIFDEISGKLSSIRNAISSSVIISSYLLNLYQQNENYFALFEAWILLAAFLLCFSKKE
ncbi:MAG: hypothetical protein ACFFD2_03305 [Promethearchaeota archaeon]